MDTSRAKELIRTILDISDERPLTERVNEQHIHWADEIADALNDSGWNLEAETLTAEQMRLSDLARTMEISPHVYHSLVRAGKERGKDLDGLTEIDVDQWERFGYASKRELIALMRSVGLEVKPSDWPTFDVFGDK